MCENPDITKQLQPDSLSLPGDLQVYTQKLPRYTEIPEHEHDFVEIACVLHGECRHIVDGYEFRQEAGSVSYLTPFVRHQLIAVKDAECFTIGVRKEFFLEMNLPYMVSFITPIMFHCGSDPLIIQLVLALYSQQNGLPYQKEMSELLFHTLMLYIGQRYRVTMERIYFTPLLNQKIIPILDYIVENYQTATLRSTAEHFHYSEAHLSRMFREKTGGTFSEKLRDFKLEQAARLLRETDKKLNDICDAVGYADVTQFIHNFKRKYQTTPGQYRKTHRSNSL